MNDELILKLLNKETTIQTIVDIVNPGKSRQAMEEYIKRHFVCRKVWKKKPANLAKNKSRVTIKS